MKSIPLLVLAALALAACGDPTAEQAASDARDRPNRADQMMAFDFAPGSARLDPSQEARCWRWWQSRTAGAMSSSS